MRIEVRAREEGRHVEIRIGIANTGRELNFETSESAADVKASNVVRFLSVGKMIVHSPRSALRSASNGRTHSDPASSPSWCAAL